MKSVLSNRLTHVLFLLRLYVSTTVFRQQHVHTAQKTMVQHPVKQKSTLLDAATVADYLLLPKIFAKSGSH
jgi:hypothetical protein